MCEVIRGRRVQVFQVKRLSDFLTGCGELIRHVPLDVTCLKHGRMSRCVSTKLVNKKNNALCIEYMQILTLNLDQYINKAKYLSASWYNKIERARENY